MNKYLKINNEEYYIDIDQYMKFISIKDREKEINSFKYDLIKYFIDILLTIDEGDDENSGIDTFSPQFKIAFNTLLKFNILKNNKQTTLL